jgi:hypothetical protein
VLLKVKEGTTGLVQAAESWLCKCEALSSSFSSTKKKKSQRRKIFGDFQICKDIYLYKIVVSIKYFPTQCICQSVKN